MRILTLLLLLASPAFATTYYVATNGNDTNLGTELSPWLTVAKACLSVAPGDIVKLKSGDYNEVSPQISIAGTALAPITFTSVSQNNAVMKGFRVNAPYIVLDGIRFHHFSDVGTTNACCIRMERVSSGSKVRNCRFTDLPHVIGNDFSFNSATNQIVSIGSNFLTAGFVTGSKIYLGASGATVGSPLYYVNHDITAVVGTVTPTAMTLASPALTADSGSNYWAFIRAGSGNSGFPAIQIFQSSGQPPPTGITIENNQISNWPGHAIILTGNGHQVLNNRLENLLSFRFISFSGSDHLIKGNCVKNCPNVLHYSPTEEDTITHPAGSGWYDYVAAMMVSPEDITLSHQRIVVENNWFENVENQIGSVTDENPQAYDIIYQKNVFIGVTSTFSGGRDGMQWLNNTFFRCLTGEEQSTSHPLSIGARITSHTGYVLRGNMFIACHNPSDAGYAIKGYYSIGGAGAISPVTTLNMVAGEELPGFPGKTNFTTTDISGVSGGDPLFLNPLDPIGPDELPFTADDGLQVLSTSPMAVNGGGACGIYNPGGRPVAHYRVTSPTGWFEPAISSYDPTWAGKHPGVRTGPPRPYNNPPRIGNVPISVSFDASASLSAVSYRWDFGDGTAVVVDSIPTIAHNFTLAGDHTVKLSVTDVDGDCHSYYNAYRFTSP